MDRYKIKNDETLKEIKNKEITKKLLEEIKIPKEKDRL